jgi:hypothetical protein
MDGRSVRSLRRQREGGAGAGFGAPAGELAAVPAGRLTGAGPGWIPVKIGVSTWTGSDPAAFPAVAVMVTDPVRSAVTFPSVPTVAIDGSLDCHTTLGDNGVALVMTGCVAVYCSVSPTLRCAGPAIVRGRGALVSRKGTDDGTVPLAAATV